MRSQNLTAKEDIAIIVDTEKKGIKEEMNMLEKIKEKLFGKKEGSVEVENEPKKETKKERGRGNWKNKKYSLVHSNGVRYRFYYRFNENEALEHTCSAYKYEEEELVKTIESLISKGYDKEEIKAKMSRKFSKKGGKKKHRKSTTRVGKMNEALTWSNDGILLYNGKRTNITPQMLQMFCTFHSNCNNNYDLIDLINQQYKYEDLLQSAVSYICINYNSLNLQKLINEGGKTI